MTKKSIAIFASGLFFGLLIASALYESAMSFSWRQYQVCADELAITRQRAEDEQKRKLEEWAADKLVIDSDKFADAILQTTKQFNLQYKAGDVPR